MNTIVIRDLAPADRLQWEGLWAGYNAFYGRQGDTAVPAEVIETTWTRFFDPAEPMHALVADRAGTLLGLTHYLFHRSTIQLQPTCYLQDLFTAEAARGTGIGRALIEAVYARARAAGSPRVYWQTHETNTTAMRLYDQVAERSCFLVYRKIF
ncbi:N-acetyltransferase [Lysobacter helvus]|uniref:N-acetyltransferase n=2 Tax=Lysobacteraceae TaxID=32033 RepID=A0ABN6FRI7_9GAMM|nr:MULTISPECIES: GNAT family N-acetyltransferase [Lysobacter]BCT92291.1 N-acetyltransferase [Lysobacter caseinilyticus]BCT95444.1 N-acetyltransferase [Lysobacter helvus]